jgi:3-oxoacyl-[acyl-carrier-protein] synthase II
MNGRRRVVVTGVGAVTPLGNDAETFWENLTAGKSGAAPIQQFDPAGFAVHFACELKDFEPTNWIEHRKARKLDRFAQMIVAAARMAESDSGIEIEPETDAWASPSRPDRRPQGLPGLLRPVARARSDGQPVLDPAIIPNMGAAWVSMGGDARPALVKVHGLCGLQHGDRPASTTSGSAAPTSCSPAAPKPGSRRSASALRAMRALSRRNADPEAASRPFDAERDGFVMGEAGGIVVLEELEHAKKRDAKIYAELGGYGISSDAQHITEPDPTGQHPARAMRMAMDDSGVGPEDIDYINAHGTSTPLGDASETRVIKVALGEEKARKTPISSTKGATGHCLGASGAIEAITSIFAVQRDVVPPTINYEYPDPQCDLDYIPNESREWKTDVALSNNFGFGGHNACLVIKKFQG